MPLMKSKRTSKMEGMTGSLEGWVTERCSAWSIHGKSTGHRRILLSWQGAEINRNILLLEALQKSICFLFSDLVVQAGQPRALVGRAPERSQVSQMMPVECRMLSDGLLGVWNLTALKALTGPGRTFNTFKYPHESKNMTFCNWNCKMCRLFSSLAVTCTWKRFPMNWLWQTLLNTCPINQHFKEIPF